MHDPRTLHEGQQEAHDVRAGEWKQVMADRSMSAKDRKIKVQQYAKKMEDKALRKEHRLRDNSKLPKIPSSQRHLHRRSVTSERENYSSHPMGKLNVSSVKAPSDLQSLTASPPMNERKELDSRVFGGVKKRITSQTGH